MGATMIAGLILTVAVIAQEHANATRGKAIIAAQLPEAAGEGAVVPAAAFPDVPTPPMLDDSSLPMPEPHTPPLREPSAASMPERLSMPRAKPAPAPAPTRAVTRPAQRPAVRAAPDPDVDLIATILMLTPPPQPADGQPVCTPAEVLENICGKFQGMQP